MFDVSWEDPASETVAQHRERKERDERNSVQSSTGSSMRSAESSDSSRTQNTRLPAKSAQASSLATTKITKRGISLLKNTKLPLIKKKTSLVTTGTSPDSQQTITGVQRDISEDVGDHLLNSVADAIQSVPISNGRSNMTSSLWSSVTASTTSKSYEIQTLAENSFVTRSTEVTTSPHDPTDAINMSLNEISISAEVLSPDEYTIQLGTDFFQFPQVPGKLRVNEVESSNVLDRKTAEAISPGLANPAGLWKPPIDWGCPPDDHEHFHPRAWAGKRSLRLLNYDDQALSPTGPTHLQRNIRRMEAANPKIMLERIREEWPETKDATIYEELEFEKHLWMLTALKYLGTKPNGTSGSMGRQGETTSTKKAPSGSSKALSLYENQASASYLATFSTATEIHHLATSPLSPSLMLDIYPLTIPSPHHQLPYAPQLFSSISSFNLPTILPSSSIPLLLRECHRVLLPSGTLSLTIVDPLPTTETFGPHFRAWLEKHLLINAEKHFRCTSPGRLLPIWLKDAGFSCKKSGAKGRVLKFWASVKGEGDAAELTAVIGKMLWKEAWGSFVEEKKWWWEDEVVMEECMKMETRWECVLVEAVKMG